MNITEMSETSLSTQFIQEHQCVMTKSIQYNQMAIHGKKYSVGDPVYIQNFIAKIIKIALYPQINNSYVPLIEVQWYIRPSELPERYKEIFNILSEDELFFTDQTSLLFVDFIGKKCKVLTFEQFDKLERNQPDTFFTRATYNTQTQTIDPPVEQWKKGCICQKAQNPDELYIQCDNCNEWFHIICLGISFEQLQKIETYHCPKCQQL